MFAVFTAAVATLRGKAELVEWSTLETLVYRCQPTTSEREMVKDLLLIVIAALLCLKDRILLLLGELSSVSWV